MNLVTKILIILVVLIGIVGGIVGGYLLYTQIWPRTGTLYVYVHDAEDETRLIAGANVCLVSTVTTGDSASMFRQTGDYGIIVPYENFPPGDYYILVDKDDYMLASRKITVDFKEGKEQIVYVALQREKDVGFTLKKADPYVGLSPGESTSVTLILNSTYASYEVKPRLLRGFQFLDFPEGLKLDINPENLKLTPGGVYSLSLTISLDPKLSPGFYEVVIEVGELRRMVVVEVSETST